MALYDLISSNCWTTIDFFDQSFDYNHFSLSPASDRKGPLTTGKKINICVLKHTSQDQDPLVRKARNSNIAGRYYR